MKWAAEEPNDHLENEKCLSINKGHKTAQTRFNNINCEHHKGFFCQKFKNPKESKHDKESEEENITYMQPPHSFMQPPAYMQPPKYFQH